MKGFDPEIGEGSQSAIIDIVHTKNKIVVQEGERRASPFLAGFLPPRWGGPIYRLLMTKPSLDEDIYSVKEKNEKTEREKETEVYYLINRIIQRVIIGVWARKTEANKHTNMTVESLILAQDER